LILLEQRSINNRKKIS